MNESHIRKLFMVLENAMPFAYDDFKVELWRSLLQHVPFEVAEENLRKYLLLPPEKRYPIYPGVLAAGYGQSEVPNAAETRAMLQARREQAKLIAPPPDRLKGGISQGWRCPGAKRQSKHFWGLSSWTKTP